MESWEGVGKLGSGEGVGWVMWCGELGGVGKLGSGEGVRWLFSCAAYELKLFRL